MQDPPAVREERNHRDFPGLPLSNGELFDNGAAMIHDIFHAEGEEVDAPQHGVNTHRKQRQVAEVAGIL